MFDNQIQRFFLQENKETTKLKGQSYRSVPIGLPGTCSINWVKDSSTRVYKWHNNWHNKLNTTSSNQRLGSAGEHVRLP